MTVFENVAFPLIHRKERLSKAALRERVRMAASLDVKEGDEVFVRVGPEHCVPVEAV